MTALTPRSHVGARAPAIPLLGAIVLTIGVIVPWEPARVLLVGPVAFIAPGWLIQEICGVRTRLQPLEHAVLCVLLSLCSYSLLALLLSALKVRISETSILIAVDAVLVGGAAVLLVRRRSQPEIGVGFGHHWHLTPRSLVICAWLICCIGATAALAVSLPGSPPGSVVSMRLSGQWANLDQVIASDPTQRVSVQLAVTNQTSRPERFLLTGEPDLGRPWAPQWLSVGVGQTWRGAISGRVPTTACVSRLVFALSTPTGAAVASNGVWVTAARPQSGCRTRSTP